MDGLERIGADARSAVPDLIELVANDTDRGQAFDTLRAIDAADPKDVGKLIALLGHRHRIVRFAAVRSLGRLGPAAREALPQLERFLKEESPMTRKAAEDAIARIEGAK